MRSGASRVIAGPGKQATFAFRSMRLRALTQSPADLLAEPKAPDEMRYAELGRYIDALQRSGNDANKLDRRAGAQAGAAGHLPHHRPVRRAAGGHHAPGRRRGRHRDQPGHDGDLPAPTQIMKAVGAGGLVDPILAAWIPNIVFLLAGVVLLARVRT